MTPFVEIATTTSTRQEAEAIAQACVGKRFAVCAQIVGPLTSIYHWQNQVERSEEWQCTLKTRAALFAQVATAIRELHSYDCPQIVALPILDVSDDYREWMEAELNQQGKE